MERRERLDHVTLREEDGGNTLKGLAAVYYNPDVPGTEFPLWSGAVERIQPGAFDRAVKEDDVIACFNHDVSELLGRTSSGTLHIEATSEGLQYECDLGSTTTANDVREHVARGDLGGSSFAFSVRDGGQNWTTESREGQDLQVRNITDVRLYDVSAVTNPAYSATDVGLREARASHDEAFPAEPEQNDEKPATVADRWKYKARLAELGL